MKQYDLTDTLPFDQSCALAVAWENFVSKLPKDQQEDVRSRPPSLSSVSITSLARQAGQYEKGQTQEHVCTSSQELRRP
jgi:hypothetical protein